MYPVGLPPEPPSSALSVAPYGRVTLTPQDSLVHIHWLAGAGWPPEAIAFDLALRQLPTLGKDLPFVKQTWRPYMVRRVLEGLAPSATLAMGAGLISLLLNPFMLVSIAAILLFTQTRREIRDSGGRLGGTGRAVLGLGAGLLGIVFFVSFLTFQIVVALNRQS